MPSTSLARKPRSNGRSSSSRVKPQKPASIPRKERILIEFPSPLLQRTDAAARNLEKNRSEFIRAAVEQLLDRLEAAEFNRALAEAYSANAGMNHDLINEFLHVDREGF